MARPPLIELQTFEAAARHLSFTRAADELGVTQGAVSQRIKILEDRLGASLFRRAARGVALTDDGQVLADSVRRGLQQIDGGLRALGLRATAVRKRVRISVSPSFAARWLTPRIASFTGRHPDIEVSILAEDRLVDVTGEDIDLAVRFGRGVYDGVEARLLMGDAIFPVCSAQVAATLRSPADLSDAVLLYDVVAENDASGCSWREWARTSGVELRTRAGPSFNHANLALDAAAAGAGVALARRALVEQDLAAGRLVRPFDLDATTRYSYFVLYPKQARSPSVEAFADWLFEEARESRA